jgi:hypothetical protein
MSASEEWREVVGFPLYQVSDLGRVRRHPDHPSHLPREALAASQTSRGYLCVRLMRDKRAHWLLVHILVCEAFHGPKPSPDHEVAHGDGRPGNARADNLRWATKIENHADKRAHGTHREGVTIPWARLNERDVHIIRSLLADHVSPSTVARAFGVSVSTIEGIKYERNWKHVA